MGSRDHRSVAALLAAVVLFGCGATRPRISAKPTPPPGAVVEGDPAAPNFDRGAVAAALGGVDVQRCTGADGPTGLGHVVVLFLPDGTVGDAVLDDNMLEELNPFVGTPRGACLVEAFKKTGPIPPFRGKPVTVGKSFTVR